MPDALDVRDALPVPRALPVLDTSSAPSALPLRHAVALGLLHGPAELLPVSSSGHTALVPWLLGWRYRELDPSLRKSFEVALHAGTAVGLLVRPPWNGGARLALPALACAVLPPALAGYALGERIERRLGSPATIAAGLAAGSLAMAAGELQAARGRTAAEAQAACTCAHGRTGAEAKSACKDARGHSPQATRQASARDGLALGLAQAAALAPGLSRSGLAFAAARACGFSSSDADRLSWKAGIPVIAGAASLKGVRLARSGVPAHLRAQLAAGAGAALASTLLSARALTRERRTRLVWPAIFYRIFLAALVVRSIRDNTRGKPLAGPAGPSP